MGGSRLPQPRCLRKRRSIARRVALRVAGVALLEGARYLRVALLGLPVRLRLADVALEVLRRLFYAIRILHQLVRPLLLIPLHLAPPMVFFRSRLALRLRLLLELLGKVARLVGASLVLGRVVLEWRLVGALALGAFALALLYAHLLCGRVFFHG